MLTKMIFLNFECLVKRQVFTWTIHNIYLVFLRVK